MNHKVSTSPGVREAPEFSPGSRARTLKASQLGFLNPQLHEDTKQKDSMVLFEHGDYKDIETADQGQACQGDACDGSRRQSGLEFLQ